jgi:hypothetical protein
MPYTAKQVRLFQMIKHGKVKRKGLSAGKAAKMLTEAGQSRSSGHKKGK